MPPPVFTPSIGKMDQTIVILEVGPDHEIFQVHEGVLCAQSPFFAKALSKNWKEGHEKRIVLEDTSAKIWKQYILDWFYKGWFTENNEELLVEGYRFAFMYDVPDLRSQIMKSIYSTYMWEDGSTLPSYKIVCDAFDGLPDGCHLCELFLDLYGSRWDGTHEHDECGEDMFDELPELFIRKLLLRLGKRTGDVASIEYMSYYLEATEHDE